MLVASPAGSRDVMSAGWPPLSFVAWAVGNTTCSLVRNGSGLQCSTRQGYRDKRLKTVVLLLQARHGSSVSRQQLLSKKMKNSTDDCKTDERYLNGMVKVLLKAG